MAEYKNYIERRERVQAMQFLYTEESQAVAREFRSNSYELRFNDETFQLDVIVEERDATSGLPATRIQRINRGDFIVRQAPFDVPKVVPYREFCASWEKE